MEFAMMPSHTSPFSVGLRPSQDSQRPRHAQGEKTATVTDRRYNLPAAFSLLELLVVIAIIGLLAGLIVPSIASILQGTNLEQGARVVFDQISLTRQIASTRNCTTELRMIKLTNGSGSGYNALQIWVPGTNATMRPINKLVTLPQAVVISEDGTGLSKIVSLLSASNMPAGGAAAGAPYVGFSIRPSGAVVPTVSGAARADLYLTVVPARMATNTSLPPNYATIQLNPDTGTPLVFRP